ncbi:HAD family hydrolase [Sunxiuqinia sp. A32]|uniref:HAD family hydrolase n=1 Tax=Sunxiuqinia sp. A32 TaxID=3461496 RepID=UPI0040457639
MSFKGVIFDFNGTLFWDTHLHNEAWDLFLTKHQITLSDQEKNERIHGKNNRDIFKGIFERNISEEELSLFIEEKEGAYRNICVKTGLCLASGAETLFNDLKDAQIPFTIATASGLENVSFYFEQFDLHKWFDFEKVVYDDGTLRGKPNPDFFNRAMNKLNLEPKSCVVFEDSYAGIGAAENANAGKIFIVNSTNSNYSHYAHQVITNFSQVDRKIFHPSES